MPCERSPYQYLRRRERYLPDFACTPLRRRSSLLVKPIRREANCVFARSPLWPCRPWQKRTTSENAVCFPPDRSEEHTSELQSPSDVVCRLLLEKKKTLYQPIVADMSG